MILQFVYSIIERLDIRHILILVSENLMPGVEKSLAVIEVRVL